MSSVAASKETLRQKSLQRRKGQVRATKVPPDLLLELLDTLSPRLVGLYMAMEGELDVRNLEGALKRRGTPVAFPVVRGKSLLFREPREDLWKKDALGFSYPLTGLEVAPDLLFVPALAADGLGGRLGRGGGYYDRYLEKAHPNVVACVYEDDIVDHVPRASWDRPVDWILTQKRCFRCGKT